MSFPWLLPIWIPHGFPMEIPWPIGHYCSMSFPWLTHGNDPWVFHGFLPIWIPMGFPWKFHGLLATIIPWVFHGWLMEITHEFTMVDSYGQKAMENSWVVPHDFSMVHFCKGVNLWKFSKFNISKTGRDFFAKISETVGVHIAHMAFFSNWGRPPNLGVVGGPIFEDFGTGPGAAPPMGKVAQPGPVQFGPNYRGWSSLTKFPSRGHCPQNFSPHNPPSAA